MGSCRLASNVLCATDIQLCIFLRKLRRAPSLCRVAFKTQLGTATRLHTPSGRVPKPCQRAGTPSVAPEIFAVPAPSTQHPAVKGEIKKEVWLLEDDKLAAYDTAINQSMRLCNGQVTIEVGWDGGGGMLWFWQALALCAEMQQWVACEHRRH